MIQNVRASTFPKHKHTLLSPLLWIRATLCYLSPIQNNNKENGGCHQSRSCQKPTSRVECLNLHANILPRTIEEARNECSKHVHDFLIALGQAVSRICGFTSRNRTTLSSTFGIPETTFLIELARRYVSWFYDSNDHDLGIHPCLSDDVFPITKHALTMLTTLPKDIPYETLRHVAENDSTLRQVIRQFDSLPFDLQEELYRSVVCSATRIRAGLRRQLLRDPMRMLDKRTEASSWKSALEFECANDAHATDTSACMTGLKSLISELDLGRWDTRLARFFGKFLLASDTQNHGDETTPDSTSTDCGSACRDTPSGGLADCSPRHRPGGSAKRPRSATLSADSTCDEIPSESKTFAGGSSTVEHVDVEPIDSDVREVLYNVAEVVDGSRVLPDGGPNPRSFAICSPAATTNEPPVLGLYFVVKAVRTDTCGLPILDCLYVNADGVRSGRDLTFGLAYLCIYEPRMNGCKTLVYSASTVQRFVNLVQAGRASCDAAWLQHAEDGVAPYVRRSVIRMPHSAVATCLTRACAHCAQVHTQTRTCPRCRMASYCSQACFRRDWNRHKRLCAVVANHEDGQVSSSTDSKSSRRLRKHPPRLNSQIPYGLERSLDNNNAYFQLPYTHTTSSFFSKCCLALDICGALFATTLLLSAARAYL